ncbi:hypothetical protein BV20DRAFT_1058458 [Pilatotrama ljubarskyi]|nr:hypothetical protein BV20DRAFT_1058458 [Pilatotrama ljubarskyi]
MSSSVRIPGLYLGVVDVIVWGKQSDDMHIQHQTDVSLLQDGGRDYLVFSNGFNADTVAVADMAVLLTAWELQKLSPRSLAYRTAHAGILLIFEHTHTMNTFLSVVTQPGRVTASPNGQDGLGVAYGWPCDLKLSRDLTTAAVGGYMGYDSEPSPILSGCDSDDDLLIDLLEIDTDAGDIEDTELGSTDENLKGLTSAPLDYVWFRIDL